LSLLTNRQEILYVAYEYKIQAGVSVCFTNGFTASVCLIRYRDHADGEHCAPCVWKP